MSPLELGIASVVAIVVLIYIGLYIPAALAVVSFLSIWLMRDNFELALNLLKIAISDNVMEYTFATVPLFTFMGLVASKAGLGADIYAVMNDVFKRVRGGIGMATVGANAVFAAVTGSSIASASVFTRVAVPEMLRFDYNPRFAVGVVAGSSVLGMIIPPSAMLIIYSFVAEQSVGQMFLAGIGPGLLLALAYITAIFFMGRFTPRFIGGRIGGGCMHDDQQPLSGAQIMARTTPTLALIVTVLGGIYTGWMTPVEAGAIGSIVALLIAVLRRRLTWPAFKEALLETGHITASILFLITAASIYSRMLGLADLPGVLAALLHNYQLEFLGVMLIYVVLMLFLGTLLDTASIILIVVPLFLPIIEPMGSSLVWFGIVTVIGAEIGLLTPPLGISCFVIKSSLGEDCGISLKDVFLGALPFAFVMLLVLVVLIRWPAISIGIL
ncbi:MAG: TRAP transporter large permease subunit [Gammaproteobacteria bacterium]|nr:TRAP transporter large permease subunit [Gammaproteobacteria bacterium]